MKIKGVLFRVKAVLFGFVIVLVLILIFSIMMYFGAQDKVESYNEINKVIGKRNQQSFETKVILQEAVNGDGLDLNLSIAKGVSPDAGLSKTSGEAPKPNVDDDIEGEAPELDDEDTYDYNGTDTEYEDGTYTPIGTPDGEAEPIEYPELNKGTVNPVGGEWYHEPQGSASCSSWKSSTGKTYKSSACGFVAGTAIYNYYNHTQLDNTQYLQDVYKWSGKSWSYSASAGQIDKYIVNKNAKLSNTGRYLCYVQNDASNHIFSSGSSGLHWFVVADGQLVVKADHKDIGYTLTQSDIDYFNNHCAHCYKLQ